MIRTRAFQSGNRPALALCVIAGLVMFGCTQVPELEATIPDHLRDAPYPELIALDEAFGTVHPPREQAGRIERQLAARRARLQSRAKGLNARVLDPATRARMREAIAR